MTQASHATIGALIAVTVKKPELALPLAFLSHFAADALPHFDYPGHHSFKLSFKHRLYRWVAKTQLVLLTILFLVLFHFHVGLYVYAASLLAISPDLEWVIDYYFFRRHHKKVPITLLTRFHNGVQWAERPWCIIFEIPVYIVVFLLLINQLR